MRFTVSATSAAVGCDEPRLPIMKRETVQGIVEEWQEATIEALVYYSAPSHRSKMVWAACLFLIDLQSEEPELNSAERVFEELCRVVKREVYRDF